MKPKVIVNCAMSADGKIALPDRTEVKISGEEDFERVHKLRNSVDAILVGIGTVMADDPKLTVKEKYVDEPKQPLKVILDSKGRTPEDAQLFDRGEYLIATTKDISKERWVKCGEGDKVDLKSLIELLNKRGIESLLVEGGGEVIYSFLKGGLVDELSIFVGSLVIGGRDAPTPADGEGAEDVGDTIELKLKSFERMDEGILLRYKVGLK
ncbi:MAG: 2,5-diamino-6-(ribosylamino)-4(3H)-pyrimidinone 5'-phosphate reductase [Thermoplasmatota archaeon]